MKVKTDSSVLGVVDSSWGNGGVLVFLHVVYTSERVIPYLNTDCVVWVELYPVIPCTG